MRLLAAVHPCSSIMRKTTLLLLFRHSAFINRIRYERRLTAQGPKDHRRLILQKTKDAAFSYAHSWAREVGAATQLTTSTTPTLNTEHYIKKNHQKIAKTRAERNINSLSSPATYLARSATKKRWRSPLRSASWRQPNMSPTDTTDHSTPHPP